MNALLLDSSLITAKGQTLHVRNGSMDESRVVRRALGGLIRLFTLGISLKPFSLLLLIPWPPSFGLPCIPQSWLECSDLVLACSLTYASENPRNVGRRRQAGTSPHGKGGRKRRGRDRHVAKGCTSRGGGDPQGISLCRVYGDGSTLGTSCLPRGKNKSRSSSACAPWTRCTEIVCQHST